MEEQIAALTLDICKEILAASPEGVSPKLVREALEKKIGKDLASHRTTIKEEINKAMEKLANAQEEEEEESKPVAVKRKAAPAPAKEPPAKKQKLDKDYLDVRTIIVTFV